MMQIMLIGFHHQSPASTPWLEKLSLTPEKYPDILQDCYATFEDIEACMVLSTCHRYEWLIISKPFSKQHFIQWLADKHALCAHALEKICYLHHHQQAIEHLIRTASGLDSMILGDPQIFGQLKQALSIALAQKPWPSMLIQLFNQVFSAAKQIRHKTNIGQYPITIPYTIFQLTGQIFDLQSTCPILCVGAGEIMQAILPYLHAKGCSDFIMLNRSPQHAQKLAEQVGGQYDTLDALTTHLPKAHVMISGISCQEPILDKHMIKAMMPHRRYRPLLIIDLGMPRNIDVDIQELPDVFLYNLEHLQTIIDTHKDNRNKAAKPAEQMAKQQSLNICQDISTRQSLESLKKMRKHIENQRDQILASSLSSLDQGKDPRLTLEKALHDLTQHVLHLPTRRLKHAIKHQEKDMIQLASQWLSEEASS